MPWYRKRWTLIGCGIPASLRHTCTCIDVDGWNHGTHGAHRLDGHPYDPHVRYTVTVVDHLFILILLECLLQLNIQCDVSEWSPPLDVSLFTLVPWVFAPVSMKYSVRWNWLLIEPGFLSSTWNAEEDVKDRDRIRWSSPVPSPEPSVPVHRSVYRRGRS